MAQSIDHDILAEVSAEAIRALGKHGLENTPLNPQMDRRDKLVILAEELGEVARCLTYDQDHAGDLGQELVQLATMALMWAESEINAEIAAAHPDPDGET